MDLNPLVRVFVLHVVSYCYYIFMSDICECQPNAVPQIFRPRRVAELPFLELFGSTFERVCVGVSVEPCICGDTLCQVLNWCMIRIVQVFFEELYFTNLHFVIVNVAFGCILPD